MEGVLFLEKEKEKENKKTILHLRTHIARPQVFHEGGTFTTIFIC